ncbi:MAG: alpha/beta hydrolase [Acutalibacteraceae bacterium]
MELDNKEAETTEFHEMTDEEAWAEVQKDIKRRKKIIKIIAVVVAAYLVLFSVFGVVFSLAMFKRNGMSSFVNKQMANMTVTDENGREITDTKEREWLHSVGEIVGVTNREGKTVNTLQVKNADYSRSYAVLCHPYGVDFYAMSVYAKHYYEMGFNVVVVEARGHGDSEYSRITMGWLDRFDVVDVTENIVKQDEKAKIVIHGVSMGGATAVSVSGEALPSNVFAIIDDCGFESVWKSLSGQLKENHIPSFPLLYVSSGVTDLISGWSFKEASPLEQVKKATVPMLFIHGENDSFVHISQSNNLFMACNSAVKKQVVIKDADHANSVFTDSEKYWNAVDSFILENFGF